MAVMTYSSLNSDLIDYLDRDDDRLIAQIPNFINLGEIRCAREVKNLGLKTTAVSSFSPGQYAYQKPDRWLETISINYGSSTSYTTTSRANSSGTRTLVLSSAHDFSVGDSLSVFNVGGSGYNGTFVVSAVTQNSVSYIYGSGTEATTADAGGIVCEPLEQRNYLKPRSYEFCSAYWQNRTQTGTPAYYSDYDFNYLFIVPTPQISNPFEIVFYQRPMPLSESNQTNWFTEFAPDMLLYASLLEAVPYLKNDQRIPIWKDYYMQSAGSIKLENKERINDATIKRME